MTKSKKTTDLPITDTNTDTMTSLEPFLQKLGDILVNNDAQAVWCSSQGFMMERDGVMTPVSLDTGADDIVDLIGQVEEPFLTPEGILIERFGDSLVARSSNLLPKGLDSAVEKGWLSSLAAKFLDASAGLGRNILVAGPAWAAQALAWQLAHKEGAAVFSANPIAVPPGFVAVPELDAHARHHFTRLLAITKMDELVSLMTQNSSVIAVADATTLEKALLRYEAAVERVYPSASGPLQVLAGIDLVVVLGAQSEPRVKAIAEIRMAAEGYMPHLLFTTGVEPAPGALVPVAQPSWLDDFLAAGHAVLAGDLQSLAPASAPRPAPHPASHDDYAYEAPVQEPTYEEPARQPAQPTLPVVRVKEPSFDGPKASKNKWPELEEERVDAPPPGWELDQLDADEVVGQGTAAQSAEDAKLAATFGLGPPPSLTGAASSMPPVRSKGFGFEEALSRAKVRQDGEPVDVKVVEPIDPT